MHNPWRLVWSPANQAWLIMFGTALQRVVNTKEEALSLLNEWGVMDFNQSSGDSK